MTIVPEIASAVGIISIFLFLLRCYSTCKVVLAAVKLDSIINKADLITGGNTWYRERNGYRFSESNIIVLQKLGLASLQSERNFANDFNKNETLLDILINNTGVMMCSYMARRQADLKCNGGPII
ncbi:hypothetical protein TrispH2_011453 [Trichoplax sp. H2]|nr:hypothetical protein TrispH2_011453 [Trichoplax sp. H2]|eukprot:RDD36617.1 hypothetical protein TrispH2_011453 [Trichoplax sp. H2]